MRHLDEMCCDQCRAKLAQIERNAFGSTDVDAAAVEAAFTDRRELLMMVEALLMVIATRRQQVGEVQALLFKLAVSNMPPPSIAQ